MNEGARDICFTEEFRLGPKYQTVYKTTLTTKSIIYEAKTENLAREILLRDVIGARVSRGSTTGEENLFHIHIFSYPLKKKRFRKSSRRYRLEHVFRVAASKEFKENETIAEEWVKCIRWLLARSYLKEGQDTGGFPPKQRFLVIINPFGGQGHALKLYNRNVRPMLDEADVDYELKVTEHAGHAKEIALMVDVLKLDCILFCSGDGLIHEVVNGLMSRPDWKEAIKIPLGHIPCGSGNGLCATVLHYSMEPFDVTSSVFAILRGVPVPLDIVKAETSKSEIHYSILGIVQGLVADIDIESEKYRYLGDARFTIMAMKMMMELRCFSGKVWYLPLEDYDYTDIQVSQIPSCSCGVKESKSHQSNGGKTVTVCDGTPKEKSPMFPTLKSGIPNMLLPDMQDPLPDSWKCIEGSFVGWSFVTLSHIGKDIHFVPGAELGGGVIYGAHITDEITRKEVINIFKKVKLGEHVNVNGFHVIKARAFRLEPYSSSSKIITIDGELVEYGKIQAEIYKGLGRVRCLQRADIQ